MLAARPKSGLKKPLTFDFCSQHQRHPCCSAPLPSHKSPIRTACLQDVKERLASCLVSALPATDIAHACRLPTQPSPARLRPCLRPPPWRPPSLQFTQSVHPCPASPPKLTRPAKQLDLHNYNMSPWSPPLRILISGQMGCLRFTTMGALSVSIQANRWWSLSCLRTGACRQYIAQD